MPSASGAAGYILRLKIAGNLESISPNAGYGDNLPEKGVFMKFKFVLVLATAAAMLSACKDSQSGSVELRIASYNMAFCRNTADLEKTWEPRKDVVMEVLRGYNFDICGSQEPYGFQIRYLAQKAPEYAFVEDILGDDDPQKFAARKPNLVSRELVLPNMNNPIWYKKELFDVLESGKFWFSKTPDVQSGGWEQDLWDKQRHCTWAKFRHKPSKKEFYVFNLHMVVQDKNSKNCEEGAKSAELLLAKIKEIAKGGTFFAMGDFNATDEFPSVALLNASPMLKNSRKIAPRAEMDENTSFIGFNTAKKYSAIIDHIFVSNNVQVGKFYLKRPVYGGVNPSDHLPIFIDAKF